MTEQEPVDFYHTWNLQSIATSLHASLDRCDDVVRGRGYRFILPAEGEAPVSLTLLELYPERLIARYRSILFELDLAHVRSIDSLTDTVRIDAGDDQAQASIFLDAHGAFTLVVTPEVTREAISTAGQSIPKPDEPTTPEAKEPEPPPAESEQHRVNLIGRIGAQPNFRTTPKGVLIARFPLAIRESENKTSWYTVLAFGPRAVKLEGAIKKGDAVEVIGYKHVREITRQDGSKKSVEEIYAVVVKNR